MDQKEYCEALHKEYKELQATTTFHVETPSSGKQFNPQYIDPVALSRRHEIAKELVGICKPFLSLERRDWFEIERDA